MRILLISHDLSYRGTPRFLTNCARIACDAGNNVLVWGMDVGGDAANFCLQSGIDVIIGQNKLDAALAFNPEIVHIHRAGWKSRRDTRILSTLKQVCKCKVLETSVFGAVDIHNSTIIDLHAHISKWDLWRWRRWLWPLHQPGILIPNCINTDSFRPRESVFRNNYNIPSDAFLIGRLGKTDWIELCNALYESMKLNLRLWFVTVNDYSSNRPDHRMFQEFSERIVSIPRLSSTEELCNFYSACDLTVNFSPIGESFGYSIAESMACNTPVITLSKPRNDNAQIELSATEHGGFPVANYKEAITIIYQLSQNHGMLKAAREKCRSSIERRFSTQTIAPMLLKTYDILHTSKLSGKPLERLFRNKGFTTDVSGREISNQLAHVCGGTPPLIDRIKMQLSYSLPNALRIFSWDREPGIS